MFLKKTYYEDSEYQQIMESKIQKESYTDNYKKHIGWSYGYISVCADDKLVTLSSHT